MPLQVNKPDGDNWVEGRRETDTLMVMLVLVGIYDISRPTQRDNEAWNPERINHWMPVDITMAPTTPWLTLVIRRFTIFL